MVSDTYGGMVCPILLQMMPYDMALEYSRHRGDDGEWNVFLWFTGPLTEEKDVKMRMLRMTRVDFENFIKPILTRSQH